MSKIEKGFWDTIDEINIYGKTYNIRYNHDGSYYGGEFFTRTQDITISTNSTPERRDEFALHEIVEALLTEMGFRLESRSQNYDEAYVFVMNHGQFHQFIIQLLSTIKQMLGVKDE